MLLFFIIAYLVLSVGLYFVFPKCGEAGWKGLVPGLNFAVWAKIVGRKPLYALWMLAPIVNIFIYSGLAIDLVRSFGHLKFWQSVLSVLFTPFYAIYLGNNPKAQFEGAILPKEKAYREQLEEAHKSKNERKFKKLMEENPYKKSAIREWAEAIIFAVFAAAFIRMFLIEAYVIPTSSMEGSLMVGDFLFVSKPSYGLRMPQTVAMIPLLHNRVPVVGGESYLEKPSLKYQRLKALEAIDHNDPVVFNYPEGDSVYVFPDRTWSIHDFRRQSVPPVAAGAIASGISKMVTRPMDKMDHYIKRCIGLPGDSLAIRDRQVYINGKKAQNPKNLQFRYRITNPNNAPLNPKALANLGVSEEDLSNPGLIVLTNEQRDKIKSLDPSINLEIADGTQLILANGEPLYKPGNFFPYDAEHFKFTPDNYGPIYIPKKGATIQLKPESIALYRRVISKYEGNKFSERNGEYFINGKKATTYTFKQNYYWMMGDNRHNSEDSRFWGYVPEDHIVGKPVLIWFSLKEGKLSKGINWSRIFRFAGNK
jgi:signal peptidase I